MSDKVNLLVATLLAGACWPCWAEMADCAEPLHRLQQAIVLQAPADPDILRQILELQYDAEQLCMTDNPQGGIDKLQQALALFPAGGLPAMPTLPN